jgi:hypothetical protein
MWGFGQVKHFHPRKVQDNNFQTAGQIVWVLTIFSSSAVFGPAEVMHALQGDGFMPMNNNRSQQKKSSLGALVIVWCTWHVTQHLSDFDTLAS